MRSDELREQGIAALKARRVDDARKLLAEAIKLNPRDAEAWAYMGVMSTDTNARLQAFRRALEIDSTNKTALTSLKALGIDPLKLLENRPADPPKPTPAPSTPTLGNDDPRLSTTESDFNALFGENPEAAAAIFGTPKTPSPAAKPAAPDPTPDLDFDPFESPMKSSSEQNPFTATSQMPSVPQPTATGSMPVVPVDVTPDRLRPPKIENTPDGIPLPPDDYLEEAAAVAEKVVARVPKPHSDNIQWVKKEKNRAGEADVWQLRIQAGAAIVAVLLVLGTLAVMIGRDPAVQRFVGVRTTTPSRTPTNTPTATPGITPTPTATLSDAQATAATPSPAIPTDITPKGPQNPNITPLPTEQYAAGIFQLEGVMPRVIATYNAGDAASVLPTLDVEVRLVSVTFNPNPYYYKALAQARTGDFDGALETLAEAEERAETDTRSEQRPFALALIQSGVADVELLRAQTLRRTGSLTRANQSYSAAIRRAEDAIANDQQNARAHLVIIQAAIEQQRFDDALEALEFALGEQVGAVQFRSHLDFIVIQGQLYLARAATLSGQAAYLDYEQADLQGRAAIFANPFDRRGHELRIAVALAQNRAGDAVLLNDTYRLYFQNDPRALKLLGDARILEGNPDLAFNSYSDAATAALNSAGRGEDAAAALVARSELLLAQGEGGLALSDLNAAYQALPDVSIRAKRMDAAYMAGDYALALEDATALVGSGALPDDVFYLMQARVRYDLAAADSQAAVLAEAEAVLGLLARTQSALPTDLRPIAEEYRARAALALGELEMASVAANTAFNLSATPALQLLRADVRAAQGRFDEARADYLAALDQTADVDEGLALLARAGLEQLPVRITATAVVITATAQAVGTATAEFTMTSMAATNEAIVAQTATAQASLTPTLTPTPTPES